MDGHNQPIRIFDPEDHAFEALKRAGLDANSTAGGQVLAWFGTNLRIHDVADGRNFRFIDRGRGTAHTEYRHNARRY